MTSETRVDVKCPTMTDADVVAAIRANHLKANIDQFEREPKRWGAPQWDKAWLDPGGSIFGPPNCPYVKVPISGGEWDGTVQRVYAPSRLRRRIQRLWTPQPEAAVDPAVASQAPTSTREENSSHSRASTGSGGRQE